MIYIYSTLLWPLGFTSQGLLDYLVYSASTLTHLRLGVQQFLQAFQTSGIQGMMVWWHISEANQGDKAPSKEIVVGSLDDPKERWGMYILWKFWHMAIDNVDHCSILRGTIKERMSSLEGMQECMCHIFTRWNQHNMSSYGVWGGWPQ